jgi:hypothetical protein
MRVMYVVGWEFADPSIVLETDRRLAVQKVLESA